MLYGINLVRTMYDSSVRRGAIVKAMCILSSYHFIDIFRAPLLFALDTYFSNPYIEIIQTFFESLNSFDMTLLPHPNIIHQLLMSRGVLTSTLSINRPMVDYRPSSWLFNTNISFYGNKISITVPLYRTPDEIDSTDISLLVKIFGRDTMKIYNALLSKQRVVFVGYNHAAYDVCQMVISAIAMISPPILNIIRRTYPYANITDLSFLSTDGYIAGVTNPLFQERYEWWDLLCSLDLENGSGTIYTSEEKRLEIQNKNRSFKKEDYAYDNNDMKFINHVSQGEKIVLVCTEDFVGVAEYMGEDWVKYQFRNYTDSIVSQAHDLRNLPNSVKLSDRSRRFFEQNLERVSSFRSTGVTTINSNPYIWLPLCRQAEELIGMKKRELISINLKPMSPEIDDSVSSEVAFVVDYILSTVQSRFDDEVNSNNIDSDFDDIDEGISAGEYDDADGHDEGENSSESLPRQNSIDSEGFDDLQSILIVSHVRRLQCEVNLSSNVEVEVIYSDLNKFLHDEASLQIFLICLQETRGGLYLIALGLLHANPSVRHNTFLILQRIQLYDSTRQAFESLNGFLHKAFLRQKRRFEDGSSFRDAMQHEMRQQSIRNQKNAIRDKQHFNGTRLVSK